MSVMIAAASAAKPATFYLKQLQAYYQSEPPRCLGEKEWPINVATNQAPWEKGRLLALVDAGLAEIISQGKKSSYSLTSTGQKNFQRYGDLCYGRVAVSSIKLIEPTSNDATAVYFTWHLVETEKWSYSSSLRVAFSELDHLIAGSDNLLYRATFLHRAGQSPELSDFPVPANLDY